MTPPRTARTSIEATVLAAGWLLGGSVGVGTVLYAFGIGPLVQIFLRITPTRGLAVSGWASVADASDLGPATVTPVEYGTMVECQPPEQTQPTPTC